jgi:hypothetical protein
VTFVPVDHLDREGYLDCDFPGCGETSSTFVGRLRGELPDGWVLVTRVRPGEPRMEHLCPRHAVIDRDSEVSR